MLNLSTDVRVPRLADKFCQFGLTEVVLPLVVGAMTSAGVGAATAGAIGAIATPALIGAGGGALLGAGGELIKGGKPFKGMLTGAKTGAMIGGALAAPGALAQAFPETMTSLGMGPAMASLGADGTYTTGPGGFMAGETAGMPTGAMDAMGGGQSLGALTGLDPATAEDLYGAGALPGGATASPLALNAAQGAAGTGGTLRTLLNIGALGQALTKPAAPNYGAMPGPATTAATRGPYFDAPLQTTGYLNRTLNPNYTPVGGDYYHYGENAGQPNFFQDNQIKYPGLPARMAQGGAIRQHYAEGGGQVEGDGDGLSDSVPAMLSDGEYVLTAADVSRIGSGSTDAGTKRLDQMRQRLASDVGAKKLQPRPKAPLQYLRGGRAA